VGHLQEAVGQRRLPVVDVADDGEVPDPRRVGHLVMVSAPAVPRLALGGLLQSLPMANIQSQVKRNRQNERRRVRNKAVRSRLKTDVKQTLESAEQGDLEAARAAYRETARELDKAASKGMVHPRTAARRKSRLAKRLNQQGE
jgi:small subunit ribosomal protein S20